MRPSRVIEQPSVVTNTCSHGIRGVPMGRLGRPLTSPTGVTPTTVKMRAATSEARMSTRTSRSSVTWTGVPRAVSGQTPPAFFDGVETFLDTGQERVARTRMAPVQTHTRCPD